MKNRNPLILLESNALKFPEYLGINRNAVLRSRPFEMNPHTHVGCRELLCGFYSSKSCLNTIKTSEETAAVIWWQIDKTTDT